MPGLSRENVEILNRGIARYNQRDIDGFLDLAHPELEWHSAFVAVEGSVFRGLSATREYFAEIARTWEIFQLNPREYLSAGDIVIAACDCYGKGRASGVEINTPIWTVWWFREAKAFKGMTVLMELEAFEATGLAPDRFLRIPASSIIESDPAADRS
jgi:ketosteroid isomerase-like protein